MKFARIAVLLIAIVAGGLAALLVGGDEPAAPSTDAVQNAPMTEVLVASADIPMGQVVAAGSVVWRAWPEAGAGGFITKAGQPNAIEEVTGAIARQPIISGEPIRMQKVVKADGSGFMAAILPAGMRAVATPISAETGAGGFILPNDRVDVILTKKNEEAAGNAASEFTSSTILSNVRVLAIDQAASEQDGQKVVIGQTATLELSPRQAEILALARQMGTLSLSLRALVDATPGTASVSAEDSAESNINDMTIIRFGVPTQSIQR